MSKAQIWFLLSILLMGILGGLWISFQSCQLAESRAWTQCIKENDQASAQNLVCRSQYPGAYQRFVEEYQRK
jgi:hypothetical protein